MGVRTGQRFAGCALVGAAALFFAARAKRAASRRERDELRREIRGDLIRRRLANVRADADAARAEDARLFRDAAMMERVLAEGGFEGVVHLAALAGVRPSLERPAEYADVNVRGTSSAAKVASTTASDAPPAGPGEGWSFTCVASREGGRG